MEDILNNDERYRYMLLDRMYQDCKYYLGFGNRNSKFLWAGDKYRQIEYMVALYNSFDDDKKPEWITLEEIHKLKEQMCEYDNEC